MEGREFVRKRRRKAEECKKAGWRKEPVEDLSPLDNVESGFRCKKEHRAGAQETKTT